MSGGKETVPCKFCGAATTMLATQKCDACWGVTSGLSRLLRYEAGREFVRRELAQAEADAAPVGIDCRLCEGPITNRGASCTQGCPADDGRGAARPTPDAPGGGR